MLLDCLLTDDGLDLAHFANGLLRWLHEGFCAVDGDVFDVGIQTRTALARLAAGTPPEAAGPTAANRNGNGSLMRVLPLALWHRGEDVELMQLAARQSLPTHGHMRAQVCCALYCLWARAILAKREQPWMWAAQALREHGATCFAAGKSSTRCSRACCSTTDCTMTIRTSQTDPLHIDALGAGNGLIGITLCPGKHQTGAWLGTWQRDLATDMKAIEAWGASDVVTLIEAHEFTELEVTDLGDAVRQTGKRWHHLPITDGCAPDARFERDWPPVRDALLGTLANHGRVLIHCKGGLGRAGTVATLLLHAAEPSLSIAEALQRVRAARKGAVETHEQEAWLLSGNIVP